MLPTEYAACRIPVFSMQTTLAEAWPTLKSLIASSSPDFYREIAGLDAGDLAAQREKVRFTIWKYFNRSKYRTTPFGQFATVSLLAVKPTDPANIIVSADVDVYNWADWSAIATIPIPKKHQYKRLYRTNPTVYAHGEEYRYLFRENGQFSLNAVPRYAEIEALIELCKSSRSFSFVISHLTTIFDITVQQCERLLRQLVELQVIQHSAQPNITGSDYLERVDTLPQTNTSTPAYTISTRAVQQSALSTHVLRQIEDYIQFIPHCLPIEPHPELVTFKARFNERWEHQAVPLSLALDPILGIPYGNDVYPAETELLESLNHKKRPSEDQFVRYGAFQQFLLKHMLAGEEIRLEKFDVIKTSASPSLPNTLSVHLHFYQDKPVIHSVGGATATALLGRFTHVPEFHSYGIELSQLEQQANPDVVFFDLAYDCEGKVDNVNRRKQLYPMELAFSSWSTMDLPLRMEDVLVSIQNDQIVLHHRQSGKRLVPRLSSAYNYNRSDLAHFRFLCDLQHQRLQTNLSLDLSNIFPNMPYYPRVYYKDCIIHIAKWQLPHFSSTPRLRNWLREKAITGSFTVGEGDQTLLIDPTSEEDLQFLLLYQKNNTHAYISEALLSEHPMVKDDQARSYHATFIVDFHHTQTCHPGYCLKKESLLKRDEVFPGSEWLYLELYMHPLTIDSFLTNEIKTFLSAQRLKIKQWFFIRYNDPEDHLRLRIKLKEENDLPDILKSIHNVLEIAQKDGRIKKILIKEYDREIFRYDPDRMEWVEHFFYEDSKAALSDIDKSVAIRYKMSMSFIQMLCERLYPDIREQSNYYRQLSESFASEMEFDKNDFKKINLEYQKHHIIKRQGNKKMIQVFDKIVHECVPDRKKQLLADLVHLHINRRFRNNQRLHEAVIYQFLYKASLSEQAVRLKYLPEKSQRNYRV